MMGLLELKAKANPALERIPAEVSIAGRFSARVLPLHQAYEDFSCYLNMRWSSILHSLLLLPAGLYL